MFYLSQLNHNPLLVKQTNVYSKLKHVYSFVYIKREREEKKTITNMKRDSSFVCELDNQ
jgi:hypothetical protein